MLNSVVARVQDLTPGQTESMYKIMETYYGNTTFNKFAADLREKRDVVLLTDEQGEIRGFTTLAVYIYDDCTQLLYSGDTIVEKEYWGRHDLSRIWVKNAMGYADGFDGTTYWFLLSKGYKTYKYLSTFFNEYYPRADTETPAQLQLIMDSFAGLRYGDNYSDGVWKAGDDYLKDEYDSTGEAASRDKNTAFFLSRNPGYMNGDELICLSEMSVKNLNKMGRRVLGR